MSTFDVQYLGVVEAMLQKEPHLYVRRLSSCTDYPEDTLINAHTTCM